MFGKDAPYGSIILIYKTFRENDKKIFYFSDFFVIISRYGKEVIFSMEGIRRGCFFCQWYIKGAGALGGTSPNKIFVGTKVRTINFKRERAISRTD